MIAEQKEKGEKEVGLPFLCSIDYYASIELFLSHVPDFTVSLSLSLHIDGYMGISHANNLV